MTQISRPIPHPHPSQVQTKILRTELQLALEAQHYEAQCFDGGSTTVLSVEAIADRKGELLVPIWGEDWVEIVPGLHTKRDAIKIQPFACPVQITFKQTRYGRICKRNYEEEHYTVTDNFQIRYESIVEPFN